MRTERLSRVSGLRTVTYIIIIIYDLYVVYYLRTENLGDCDIYIYYYLYFMICRVGQNYLCICAYQQCHSVVGTLVRMRG